MKNVTPQEVKAAMIAAGITYVEHHDCGGCGFMTHYSRQGEQLFFNPGCDCGRWVGSERREWSDASDWINMQSRADAKNRLRKSFGLPEEALDDQQG